jgi:hypothetical protein
MMEVARTSETSADNYFTRQYIPEDKSELHTRRHENLKSHNMKLSYNSGDSGCKKCKRGYGLRLAELWSQAVGCAMIGLT